MPVTLLNWIVPLTILFCGTTFVAIKFWGFSTARWGYALCLVAIGYTLMLFETERFTPLKQIAEDNFILLGIILAGHALKARLDLKSCVLFDIALMSASTMMVIISLVMFKSVRLETFFVQACCTLTLWARGLPFSRTARTKGDRLLAVTFLFVAMVLTFQCLLYIAASNIEHAVGAWRSSIWGSLVQLTGLVGSVMLAFAVMIATTWDTIEKYRAHANTDPMTKLLNRRGLEAFLASGRGKQFRNASTAIILADIDHFKAINDRFGHSFGDQVIARFAALLQVHAGSHGCAVRLGGEEFAILLPGVHLDEAVAAADRMRRTFLVEHWLQSGTSSQFTASFGVALMRDRERNCCCAQKSRSTPLRRKAGGTESGRFRPLPTCRARGDGADGLIA